MAAKKKTTINPRQKRFLRGLGHHLQVKAMLGKEGFTDQVIKSINEVVDAHELVKVRVQDNFPHDRKEAGPMLAAESGTAHSGLDLTPRFGLCLQQHAGNSALVGTIPSAYEAGFWSHFDRKPASGFLRSELESRLLSVRNSRNLTYGCRL